MYICRKAVEAWDRLLHRSVAALLAAAMTLSFLPATSWAAYPITPPVQITDDTKSQFPNIEFQTNFVRTEYGTLTGLMELAIRVGPSAKDKDGKPISVSFQSVAATLQYNTALFQPISWQWAYTEEGKAISPDIDLKTNVTSYYDVQLPAKKDDTLPGTGAIAQCGIVTPAPAGMSTNVTNGKQALLFFKAEAYGTRLEIAEMTTLAVIRFYVAPELMEHISIVRDKTSVQPDGSCDYDVFFDTKTQVTDRAGLDTLIGTANHLDSTTGSTALLTGVLGLPTDFISVGFALDGDMAESDSPANMSLHYSAGDNAFYHVPGYVPTDDPATNTTLTDVLTEVGPDKGKVKVTLRAPITGGSRVLAVAEGKDNSTTAADYSYTSNLIPSKNITFPVVSQVSFADNGDGRENMVTVLFYDWDDTLIGVLVVPRNDDARALVNDYVRDHMIHPDLRYVEGSADTLVDSLSRANSYRGKYPSTPMGENGTDTTMDGNRPATPEGNDKLVGSDYPLTNKLDYVFLKRPMEKDETAVDADNKPTNTWKQLGDETKAEWDYEYPYIHGWALIPDDDLTDIDYTHPENIWTTIGVGELTDYTGLTDGAYLNISDISDGAVELISTAEDFSIADFDFSKKENSLEKGSVYAVKALYEPAGELLFMSYAYRMISEPYYNKMNNPNAAAGGAYSVEITFERSNLDNMGAIRGVARARDLQLRQETTSDIRWEDEYLINASVSEQGMKTKTTYSTSPVDNVDEVNIQLVLSGRHNKVDYFLMEAYGASFVTGGERSGTNGGYTGSAHVIDNYNYKTDDNETSRAYYRAEYVDADGDGTVDDDRSGTYGFVLFGTLNNMLQKATEYNNGLIDQLEFNNYLALGDLADANIRVDNELVTSTYRSAVWGAFRAAAAEAQKRHDPTDADYPGVDDRFWDNVHNCAQLTYHQIQWFITDYINNGDDFDAGHVTARIRDKAAADGAAIRWCHLHEECAAQASGKPRNWAELVRTAQGFDAAGNAIDPIEKITLLTAAEVENISHIRANSDGEAFAATDIASAVKNFAEHFVEAVQAGNTTWDTIQDYIIRGDQSNAESYSRENYWWYDGTTRVSFGSLSDTVAAAQDAVFPKLVPGETAAVARTAKLNQLKDTFETDRTSGAVTTAWNNATKNLAITKGGNKAQKFASWNEFVEYFTKAVKAAEDAGVKLTFAEDDSADAVAQKTKAYWQKLQYHILSRDDNIDNTGIFVANPDTTQQAEMDGYWWYDGAVQVNNLATLIRAAQDANNGKPASMDMFAYSALYDPDNKELHFARNFQGEKYTSDEDDDTENNAHLVFSEFKEDILAYVQEDRTFLRNNAPDWNRVQFYLIHRTIDTSLMGMELGYYWWKEGKEAQPVDFTLGEDSTVDPPIQLEPTERADALASALLDAAFRSAYNGNTVAWGNLSSAVLERGRIVAGSTGSEVTFPDDFTMYGASDLATVKSKAESYMKNLSGSESVPTFPVPSATWYQIQHYLLTGEAQSDFWVRANKNYWWKEIDSQGTPPNQLFDTMVGYIKDIADAIAAGGDGVAEANILRGWLTAENAEKMEFSDGFSPVSQGDLDSIPWENLDYANTCGDPFVITWAQIEWMIVAFYNEYFDWMLDDNGTAVDYLENWYSLPSKPSWQTARMRMNAPKALVASSPDYSKMILSLQKRIADLGARIKNDPSMAEQYTEELAELLIAIQELQEIINSTSGTLEPEDSTTPVCTCGIEDGVHSSDCPLYEAATETEEPTESPAPEETHEVSESPDPAESPEIAEPPVPTESVEPSESPEPTEPPEPTESPEPTVSPEPTETASPEEPLPEPSVPGAGTPEVTPTPEAEPTNTPEPTPTPETTVTPEPTPTPEGTLETMPEMVDLDSTASEPPKEETDDGEGADGENAGTGALADPQGTSSTVPTAEAVVTETQPPLAGTIKLRSPSAPRVYNKLTTRIVLLGRQPRTAPTKRFTSAGGMSMKQLNLNRIFSPSGWPLFRAVPLLLRMKATERRSAV